MRKHVKNFFFFFFFFFFRTRKASLFTLGATYRDKTHPDYPLGWIVVGSGDSTRLLLDKYAKENGIKDLAIEDCPNWALKKTAAHYGYIIDYYLGSVGLGVSSTSFTYVAACSDNATTAIASYKGKGPHLKGFIHRASTCAEDGWEFAKSKSTTYKKSSQKKTKKKKSFVTFFELLWMYDHTDKLLNKLISWSAQGGHNGVWKYQLKKEVGTRFIYKLDKMYSIFRQKEVVKSVCCKYGKSDIFNGIDWKLVECMLAFNSIPNQKKKKKSKMHPKKSKIHPIFFLKKKKQMLYVCEVFLIFWLCLIHFTCFFG